MVRELSYYTFILVFIWFGLVAGISFLEAPVKFNAPSLTVPVGVDVGRHVFSVMNKVEAAFALLVLAGTLISRPKTAALVWLVVLLIVFLAQTFFILPRLDNFAQMVIDGMPPVFSKLHTAYVITEVLKLLCLFMLGLVGVNRLKKHVKHSSRRRRSHTSEEAM